MGNKVVTEGVLRTSWVSRNEDHLWEALLSVYVRPANIEDSPAAFSSELIGLMDADRLRITFEVLEEGDKGG